MSNYGRPEPQRGGARPGQGWPQASQPFPAPTESQLEAIILQGNAKMLVDSAEKMGRTLARSLSSSQLRSVFGTVRRIEMRWPDGATPEVAQRESRELLLLKARLAYQVGRARQRIAGEGSGIVDLEPTLRGAIDLVSDRTHFRHFVEFLEAILAYHKSEGGR